MKDKHVAKLTKIEDIAHEEDHRWKRGDQTGHMRLILAQLQSPDQRQGRRSDLESKRRQEITNVIARNGVTRPTMSADANAVAMLRDECLYLSQGMRRVNLG
jgi:hypothetical protein